DRSAATEPPPACTKPSRATSHEISGSEAAVALCSDAFSSAGSCCCPDRVSVLRGGQPGYRRMSPHPSQRPMMNWFFNSRLVSWRAGVGGMTHPRRPVKTHDLLSCGGIASFVPVCLSDGALDHQGVLAIEAESGLLLLGVAHAPSTAQSTSISEWSRAV